MALIQESVTDKIEIVTEYKHIQVRTSNRVIDDTDNSMIAESFSRAVVMCGDDAGAIAAGVDDISTVIWTVAIRDAWIAEEAANATP